MSGLSGTDLVVGAVGVSAVIGAGYSIHRAVKSIAAWVERLIDRAEQAFSNAVDASATGHLVKYHLGPNGTTTPVHERVGAIERAQADHNSVATSIGDKVSSLEKAGERRHEENGKRLTAIEERLAAVEHAQKTAAGVAEDTEARHNKETS